jgi:chaperonin GroES
MKKEKKNNLPKQETPVIKPLGDKALIKIEKEEDSERKHSSGIIIPATVKEDRGAKRGVVVAVGEGRYEDGEIIPMKIKEGDKVLFQWGDEIVIGGVEYHVVSESNVLAVIK